MPEGPAQALKICMADNKFSLGSFGDSIVESTFWVCLVYGMFTNLNNFAIDQSYTQRYCAAPSLREARKSAFWGAFLTLPVNFMLFIIGSCLYAFYKVSPGLLPEGIKSDYVFPYFIINEMPAGLTGLLIASIFCAGMSTVATSVTSSGTIIMTDFFSRLAPEAHDDRKVLVLRLSSVSVGVAGIGVALCFLLFDNALDAWWALSSVCSGGSARNVPAGLSLSVGPQRPHSAGRDSGSGRADTHRAPDTAHRVVEHSAIHPHKSVDSDVDSAYFLYRADTCPNAYSSIE